MSLAIRAAVQVDAALIFALVRELADYEKLSGNVDATPEQIAAALFASEPRLFCDIAEWNGEPAFRDKGIGKALMARLARRCVDDGLARFEWAVLDWNAPSIAFYRSIGATIMADWRICRLSGPAMEPFANERTH